MKEQRGEGGGIGTMEVFKDREKRKNEYIIGKDNVWF